MEETLVAGRFVAESDGEGQMKMSFQRYHICLNFGEIWLK